MSTVAPQREARARASRIREGIHTYLTTLRDVAAAYQERDWETLGYESWESYVEGEFSSDRLKLAPEHRQKAVAELRLAGLSTRAIGSTLGVSRETVRRDLEGDTNVSPDEVTGSDGKTYSAKPAFVAPSVDSATTPKPKPFEGPVELPNANVQAAVADAIAQHLPPDPDEPHREWRRSFLSSLIAARRPMQSTVAEVVERGNDEVIDELRRVSDDLADYCEAVLSERFKRYGANVVPMRGAK